LLDAQDEIAELKKKFRRMTQNIAHLTEEILIKEQQIIYEEQESKKYGG
jgi:hypothetical protein